MKKILIALLVISLLGTNVFAADYKVIKKEEIRKSLKFQNPSVPGELLVDNIFGSIELEGYSGKEVKLLIHKTIKARNQDKLKNALEEVELDISEDGNTIDLYVDGPFRCQQGKEARRRNRNPGYQVHYEFEIQVPHNTSVYLKTVTDGDIHVNNVNGEFEVRNVNGKIEMSEISGSGKAHTVNGRVKVQFTRNPKTDCSFKTINGDLELFFQDNLSAAFQLKTFNGDMYSDFPVTYLPAKAAKAERQKGKYVYKSNRFVGIQAGKGGPEIKMDTLNGDILINKR